MSPFLMIFLQKFSIVSKNHVLCKPWRLLHLHYYIKIALLNLGHFSLLRGRYTVRKYLAFCNSSLIQALRW